MSAIRTKFIDFDARRLPKTDHWCVCCQRDLKVGTEYRAVKLLNDEEPFAIHPDDHGPLPRKLWPIGMDCARRLGMEWTVAADGR